jgi:hypothetical protein
MEKPCLEPSHLVLVRERFYEVQYSKPYSLCPTDHWSQESETGAISWSVPGYTQICHNDPLAIYAYPAKIG